jgi:hypothetical protein
MARICLENLLIEQIFFFIFKRRKKILKKTELNLPQQQNVNDKIIRLFQ